MLEEKVIVEKKKRRFGIYTLLTLITILIVIAGIYAVLRIVGKNHLLNPAVETEQKAATTVNVDGDHYKLNEDIITILVMGIDKETVEEIGGQSWDYKEGTQLNGGQADALFLLTINPHTKAVDIVAINRNSMAEVDVFDEEGYYKGTRTLQIALQHGYGDGKEESCLRQVKAVSRMFGGITINAYAAISMDAIPSMADAVGGVPITVIEDIVYPEYNMKLHVGDEINVTGETAYWYVRLRQEDEFNSNEKRLERQKQFLTAFLAKAKAACKEDVRIVPELYNAVKAYTVTDIDLSTFVYMVSEYQSFDFDIKNIHTFDGKTVIGLQGFEEFYPDKDAFDALIKKIFYEKVEDASF